MWYCFYHNTSKNKKLISSNLLFKTHFVPTTNIFPVEGKARMNCCASPCNTLPLSKYPHLRWNDALYTMHLHWRHTALSSGKLLCSSAILRGLRCLCAIVVIVKKVIIVCHSYCIENCNSNSDHRSERKLDNVICFFTFSTCKNTNRSRLWRWREDEEKTPDRKCLFTP